MIQDPYQRKYNSSEKGKATRAAANRRRRYGLSEADYARLLEQNGCHICGRHTKLHVDHCHLTGIVRGLLCPSCNRALGLMLDNPEKLRRAADYLERTR